MIFVEFAILLLILLGRRLILISYQDQLLSVKQRYTKGCIWSRYMMTVTDNDKNKRECRYIYLSHVGVKEKEINNKKKH